MKRPSGYEIKPHIHKKISKKIEFTQEVLFIKSGKLRVDFYNNEKQYLESKILIEGDVILLSEGGHGFKVIDECEIFEVKQGPYDEINDKERFEGKLDKETKSNKVKKKLFLLMNQYSLEMKKYLADCINQRWIGSDGKYVKLLEKKLSGFVKRKFGIAVSSGTAALDIAFASLNLKKNDEVILPSFTIISCLNPIIRANAKPVFIDVDPETWNMDLTQIEKKITKKTKAILAVHIYGLPTYMPKIINLAKKYKLIVIEDASEVIGQKINKRMCGSFGDISTFSFYTNKHITTGEGGMIFTNNKKLAKKFESLKNLCFEKKIFP